MAKKLPALMFYTGDWLKDPSLRTCSYAAKGLWIDMLCLMSESDPRGFLRLNGRPYSAAALAKATGGTAEEVTPLLTELEQAGVFSLERGVIFSRRIVRDEHKRTLCSKAGKRGGGNPRLREADDPTFIGTSKGTPKGDLKGAPEDETEDETQSGDSLKGERVSTVTDADRSAAIAQFERWTRLDRGKPLMPEQNEYRPIYSMLEAVSDSPPIIQGNKTVPQHRLAPLAVNHAIDNGREFKNPAYASAIIRGILEEWATKGMPGPKPAQYGRPQPTPRKPMTTAKDHNF